MLAGSLSFDAHSKCRKAVIFLMELAYPFLHISLLTQKIIQTCFFFNSKNFTCNFVRSCSSQGVRSECKHPWLFLRARCLKTPMRHSLFLIVYGKRQKNLIYCLIFQSFLSCVFLNVFFCFALLISIRLRLSVALFRILKSWVAPTKLCVQCFFLFWVETFFVFFVCFAISNALLEIFLPFSLEGLIHAFP